MPARCPRFAVGTIALLLLVCAGCATAPTCRDIQPLPLPRELKKVTLPPYVIEPPDILEINALRLVPLPPYRIEPLDQLVIQTPDALPADPISGIYNVEPDGRVNLGVSYGSVLIAGMTLDEARAAIEKHLKQFIKNPQTSVSLAQTRAQQQVQGPHLVRPDGTVGLGIYGSVYVTGMTLAEAKQAIEEHLSQYLYRPEISLDVVAYNSKVIYVITDLGGNGETVVRLPVTGNETVLDAVGNIGGLSVVSSRHRIWIARPAPDDAGTQQIIPINWNAIARGAATATNYQLLPGDRLYVQAAPMISAGTYLDRLIAPFERVMGFTLLGTNVVRILGSNQGGFGGFGGGFGF